MLRQLNLANNPRHLVLYKIQYVLNKSGIHKVIQIIFKVSIIQNMYGMMNVITLANINKNWVLTQYQRRKHLM